jgi:hypothetical protein
MLVKEVNMQTGLQGQEDEESVLSGKVLAGPI